MKLYPALIVLSIFLVFPSVMADIDWGPRVRSTKEVKKDVKSLTEVQMLGRSA